MSQETAHQGQSRSIVEETRDLADHAQRYYEHIREDNAFGRTYRDNPYLVLAAAAGAGYIVAGGLLTPFTRRLIKMGMRAAIIPLAASQLKNFSQPPGALESS